MSACIRQTVASHPKFSFTPNFIFCSPICLNNCGVVFLWKHILVFEKLFFSFDRSNMQMFTVNITRVVWPHVMKILDLRYFWEHKPFFYHLNLIPCHYWNWPGNIYLYKDSLTMTEYTELQALKSQKGCYKVNVKISLCICVVLSWNELKVLQNLLASDHEIYVVVQFYPWFKFIFLCSKLIIIP